MRVRANRKARKNFNPARNGACQVTCSARHSIFFINRHDCWGGNMNESKALPVNMPWLETINTQVRRFIALWLGAMFLKTACLPEALWIRSCFLPNNRDG